MNIRYPIYEGVYRILTLIFRFMVANVRLFDCFSFHVRTTLPKIFSGTKKAAGEPFLSVLPAAASRLSLVRVR